MRSRCRRRLRQSEEAEGLAPEDARRERHGEESEAGRGDSPGERESRATQELPGGREGPSRPARAAVPALRHRRTQKLWPERGPSHSVAQNATTSATVSG